MSGWNQPTNNIRDEWDNVTMTYHGYDADDVLVEERPYTAEEIADATADANHKSLRQLAIAALTSNLEDIAQNDAALAVLAPTNAQVVAQVKELTRQSTRQAKQINGLVRVIFSQLDATT